MLLLYCLQRKRTVCNVAVILSRTEEDLIMQFCSQENKTLFAMLLVILQRTMTLCKFVLFLVHYNVVDFAENDDLMQCF